jgi:hypothetical protein
MNALHHLVNVHTLAAEFNEYLRTPEGQREYFDASYDAPAMIRRRYDCDEALAKTIRDMALNARLKRSYELLRQDLPRPSTEKPGERRDYACGFCGVGFATYSAMRWHEEQGHMRETARMIQEAGTGSVTKGD